VEAVVASGIHSYYNGKGCVQLIQDFVTTLEELAAYGDGTDELSCAISAEKEYWEKQLQLLRKEAGDGEEESNG
jgi:hypothetical protein